MRTENTPDPDALRSGRKTDMNHSRHTIRVEARPSSVTPPPRVEHERIDIARPRTFSVAEAADRLRSAVTEVGGGEASTPPKTNVVFPSTKILGDLKNLNTNGLH